MRPYRYLLRRIGESVVAIFFFTVFCYVIFSFGWFDFPDPPILSPPPPFTWDHFWILGNAPGRIFNFERFGFYFSHVFSGDFGQSWQTSRSVGLDLFFATRVTSALILAAFFFVLGIGVIWKIGGSLNRFEQERRGVQSDSQSTPRNEIIFLILFLINISLCGLFYHWILRTTSHGSHPLLRFPPRHEWDLPPIEILWYPALILSGVLFFGYRVLFHKSTLGIVPRALVQTPRFSTGLKDSISMFGARVGLFCGIVVSSIVFIEGGLIPIFSYHIPYYLRNVYYGLGTHFCRSFWFRFNFPLLNAWILLVGLALILITLIAELCYGLWKYGPYESTWSKLSSKYFK